MNPFRRPAPEIHFPELPEEIEKLLLEAGELPDSGPPDLVGMSSHCFEGWSIDDVNRALRIVRKMTEIRNEMKPQEEQ